MTNPKSAALLSFWRRVTTPSSVWGYLGRRFGIGHRAAFLLAFGVIFFAIGAGIVLTPPHPDPLLFHTLLPRVLRVALWCGTGAAACGLARSSRYQWLGFVGLALAPVERLVSYGLGIAAHFIPGGPTGPVGAYLTAMALYGGVLFVTRLVASWPDPPGDGTP